MKTRIGFVSNSSTTSFALYGGQIRNNGEAKLAKKIVSYLKEQPGFDDALKKCSIRIQHYINNNNNEIEEIYDLKDLLEELCCGMQTEFGPENDYLYFGKSFEQGKDNETFGEFKENISKIVKQIFGENTVCDHYSESWFDG